MMSLFIVKLLRVKKPVFRKHLRNSVMVLKPINTIYIYTYVLRKKICFFIVNIRNILTMCILGAYVLSIKFAVNAFFQYFET